MTEVAVRYNEVEHQRTTAGLALTGNQVEWTPAQQAALVHIGIADAPEGDQQVFRHVAQRVGLDPFARQIYMIGRKERGRNGQPDTVKWTIQTAIDGFRLIAERHPQYAGTLDPEWCGPDGVWRESWVDRKPPVMARVRVLRHDRQHPISLPVRFDEFAATYGTSGDLQGQWKTKPAHMIGKVAEAASLRKAFPQDFSGLYTDDEMAREHSEQARAGRVYDHSGAVTAAELTGQAPAPARDWAAEIDAAEQGRDLDALRTLYRQAMNADADDAVAAILAASSRVRETNAPAADEAVDAEGVDEPEQDPRDEQPAEGDAETVDGFWAPQGGDK